MFETDAHRACVMHHQRVKTFAGVSGGQLNYQHFEGLVKSVALEVASAMRQISSIKEQHGWPAPKVASANAEAAAKQQAFIDMFKADGKLPDALPEEWREHVVAACISCARLHVHAPVRPCTLGRLTSSMPPMHSSHCCFRSRHSGCTCGVCAREVCWLHPLRHELHCRTACEHAIVRSVEPHSRCRLQGQRERLQAAEALLRYATGYIKQHKLEALDEQGSLAAQMHELVVQKLQMLQAGRGSTGMFDRKRA